MIPIATPEMLKPYLVAYRLRARHRTFLLRVQESKEILREFFDKGLNSRVMWSGGKDSTAMLHLAWTVNPNVYATSEKDDMDFPGEKEYVRHIADRYNIRLDVIEPSESIWDHVTRYDITEQIHSQGTAFSQRFFYNVLRDYQERNGVRGLIIGLRNQESNGRRINYHLRGAIYEKRDGMHVCLPMAHWETQDVYAYLISQEIPILDVYFKTRFTKGPESIRKSWMLPGVFAQDGQAAWLRYYYPQIYARLLHTNPEIGRFT